ncbi:MAG TPA: glycosyltransferase [Blastococcus sp.]|jgi:glycosyltransferase involved in cell wall biosynthesis|nr:glycosyltransferase [Blastococcus sp.]
MTQASKGTRSARRPVPAVSVVVTVLDEGEALGRLVDDLLPQLRPGDELVIVDGGSTDGSVEALPRHEAVRVEVVPGAGISAGRNHGIGVAANEVIVCTDAGCVPAPGFVEAFRRAFATADPPALVSGLYTVHARNAMERAQALACYPQPSEVRGPTRFTRAYTKVFGTGFDPRFAVGRCVAFTREAWKAVGGFPEHLATGEDVSFGLAVARVGRCEAAPDAVTEWVQRNGLAATWRMYRAYGRASTDGGNRALLVRDAARGLAYLAAPLLAGSRTGRRVVAVGAAAYLSLPVARAVRSRATPAAVALLPVALATKDLGKLAGAVQGFWRARR